MLTLQETLHASDKGAGIPGAPWPPRLLEDSEGLTLFCHTDKVATVKDFTLHTFELGGKAYRLWSLQGVRWSRGSAFRLLQGSTLQQTVGGRYIPIEMVTQSPYVFPPKVPFLALAEPLFEVPSSDLAKVTAELYEQVKPLVEVRSGEE